MKKDILVEEIASFCFDYGVILDMEEIKKQIEDKLSEVEFLEDLINTIFVKSKNTKDIDIEKVKELLIELERIRLELEYKEYTPV